MIRSWRSWCLGIALFVSCSSAHAVILLGTNDPAANTTAPEAGLAGSGWQFQASFGPFLATAIGPHHFITVQHIGNPSNVFEYQGSTYTITQSFDDPDSDLRIFEVAENVASYAPLNISNNEVGSSVVVIGRGTQRGDPIYQGGFLRGWQWGLSDGVQRWGQNQISGLVGNLLYSTFDQNSGPNEATLSSGDSGGAVFIQQGGAWALAGINYGVDGPYSLLAGGDTFDAALFDVRGYYGPGNQLYAAGSALPSGFYSIRISSRLDWIYGIVFPGSPVPTPSPSPSPTPNPTPTPSPTPPVALPQNGAPQMLLPAPDSIFDSGTVAFSWSATGKCVVDIGTSPGASDIFSSGKLASHSLTVTGLPTDGSTIYVRLRSVSKKGASRTNDYVYTAAALGGESVPPTPTPAPNPHHHQRRG